MKKSIRTNIVTQIEEANAEQLRAIKFAKLNGKVYLTKSAGQGRHSHYLEAKALDFMDIKELGNESPRGGKEGNYVIYKENKLNKEILSFIEKYLAIR